MLALGKLTLHLGWLFWFGILFSFIGFLMKNKIGKRCIVFHRILGFVLKNKFVKMPSMWYNTNINFKNCVGATSKVFLLKI